MLSLVKGDPIAQVSEKKEIFTVNLYGKDNMNINHEEPPHLKVSDEDKLSLLDNTFFKINGIKAKDKDRLLKQIGEGVESEETQLAWEYIDNSLRKKIEFPKDIDVFPIPQLYSERIYISAPSGAGKSYFTGQYVEEIRNKFGKKRNIFIFSRVDEDKALDKFPKKVLTRIPLEKKLWDEVKFLPEDFKKSICIFDDIDTIQDKTLARKVQALRGNMLETGRHSEITVISTSHQIQNFLETRQLINEAMYVVLFPRASSIYHISNFLEKYMGLNSHQIKDIYKLNTRWIYISKQYPRYIIWQHGVMIL